MNVKGFDEIVFKVVFFPFYFWLFLTLYSCQVFFHLQPLFCQDMCAVALSYDPYFLWSLPNPR